MYDIETLPPPKYGNIFIVTDPSGADIYLDGILQPKKTSILLKDIAIGAHSILLSKSGYESYSDNIVVKQEQTTTVAVILTKIVDITDKGIVICATSNILTCPVSPIDCPILITPLDYVNLLTVLNSTVPVSLTVRFIYTIDGAANTSDVYVNLSIGTNIVYTFPTNIQYPVNTILSLEDVLLV